MGINSLDMPFIPGQGLLSRGPLARYYPPVLAGAASSWLSGQFDPGSWVLDPFGTSPSTAIEIARAGYKVLVTSNNPVTSFIIETLAGSPRQEDLRAALADLAVARKGDERLELFLQSIYSVECPNCGKPIQARSFIWQRQAETPERCVIECQFCGLSGEHPVSPSSQERLRAILPHASHTRARALERVAPMDDPVRPDVDQALQCYLPRPLYVLFTLLNRIESLNTSPARLRLLTGLMFSACDAGNTLWPYPNIRNRPRQLILPSSFKENNLWLALEDAVLDWQIEGSPVPVTQWPQPPPSTGGICLYPGRIKDLTADLASSNNKNLTGLSISSILTVLPRPNQAFWTLSALWAGWLWGREAVRPLKSALARQRYDWSWHTTALETTLSYIAGVTGKSTPFLGLIAEAEPSFISAALIAAAAAGFDLSGIALRPDQNQAQFLWKPGKSSLVPPAGLTIDQMGETAIREHLQARGEPAQYIVLHTAGVMGSTAHPSLKDPATRPAQSFLQESQASLQRIFTTKEMLIRYGGSLHSLESGLYWNRQTPHGNPSLSDEIEKEIIRYLLANPETSFKNLDQSSCQTFKGLMTPSVDLIQACLESYADLLPGGDALWQIRTGEAPAVRREDLRNIQSLLKKTGQELNYTVQGPNPIVWLEQDSQPIYEFQIIASAMVSRCVLTGPTTAQRPVIVIPGSRANLIMYKLHHDPWLNEKISAGWTFLKFRHLRSITSSLLLSRPVWEEWLPRDPLELKATQLEMF